MSRPPLFVAFAHLLGAVIIVTSAVYVHVALPVPNSPPIAVADSYTVHGSTLIGSLLANDSDPDGDPISWHGVVVLPAHGTLQSTGNPAYKIYNPQPGYVGTDSFTYRIHDSFLNLSNTATVTINVVNNPPTATNDSYTVHGSTLIGSLVANDFDSDGDSFSLLRYCYRTNPWHSAIDRESGLQVIQSAPRLCGDR